MVNKQQKYDRIDRYLRGEMVGRELQSFQHKLMTDTNFAGEVDLHRQVMDVLAAAKSNEIERAIEEVGRRFDRGSRTGSARQFLLVASAVTFIMLASIAAFYFLANSPVVPSEMADTHFEAYSMGSTLPGTSTSTLSPEETAAWEAYASKEYATAATAMAGLLAAGTDTPKLRFFLANAYVASNQAALAEPLLLDLRSSGGHAYAEAADWYLAMAFLAQSKEADAKRVLLNIAISEGEYSGQAEALYDELNGSK